MKDIGVASSDIYANRYNRIGPQNDSIGMKKLADGRILIPIAIRGSNYEREWTSNVTLGESGEAQGFSTAAGIVFSDVKSYIARKNLQSYITGGISSAEKSGSNYACIHSVINLTDVVPRVAPSAMGFKRYGVDHYIPGTVSDSGDGNKHDYLDEFISNLIKWGGLTRGVYNGGVNIQDNRYIVYGNVQRSLRGVMSILYGSSSLERSMFMSRFTSQWKTKDPAKWGELGGFIFYALRQ